MKKLAVLFLTAMLALSTLNGCGKEQGEAKIIDIELTEEQYAFGVDKTQPELLTEVNAFIQEIKEDGTLEEICNRYFSNGTPVPVRSAVKDPSKNQLVVATNAAFAPFEYTEGGDIYYGIDMEIAKLLAERLGKELVIEHMDFNAVCLSVGQQKCDIAMAGLTVAEDRKEHVNFSVSYYNASQKLIVPADCTEFDNCKTGAEVEAILAAKDKNTKIGVQQGTTALLYCEGDEDWGFNGFPVTAVPNQTGALAVQDMLNGGVDYVIIDAAPAEMIVGAINNTSFELKISTFLDIMQNKGGAARVWEGLQNTLLIAICGLLIGIVIGTLIATVAVMPKYEILPRILNGICTFYVSLFRGTPIVVQLLIFYYVLFPLMGIGLNGVQVSILVFGLNSGAYISEIMRSGIQSVDIGQMEAGRALGLSFSTTMLKIVIPQAVKNILPTLGNEFIALIKETSVVSFVGATDLYVAFNLIGTSSYEFMVPYITLALIYIVLVFGISVLIKIFERSLGKSDRRN